MKKLTTSSIVWLLAIVSILLTQIAGAVALVVLPAYSSLIQYAIMILVQLINCVIVFSACKKREYVACYKISKPTAKNLVISVLIALVTFVGMYLVSQYAFDFFVKIGVKASTIDTNGWYLVLAIIATVIFAPIGEELVFRYIVCDAMENKSAVFAVIISSLAFTFMHMSPMQTVYQLALGCVLALTVIKTGNLLYSIIVHATSNLTAIILSFFSLPTIPLYEPLVIIASVLLLVFAVLLIGVLVNNLDGREKKREIIKYNKEEKTVASIIYAIGFVICFMFWVQNFF